MRQQAGASVIHRLSTARITRFQEALQKRVVEIQRQTTGLIYEVSGGLNRLVGADVMTVVAWDGYVVDHIKPFKRKSDRAGYLATSPQAGAAPQNDRFTTSLRPGRAAE